MPYKGKPLKSGNPLYKEIQYKGKSFIQGEPLVNTMGNHVKGNPVYKKIPYKKEIPYTRKPLTCGNSCKVKCLRKGNPKKSLVNGNPL